MAIIQPRARTNTAYLGQALAAAIGAGRRRRHDPDVGAILRAAQHRLSSVEYSALVRQHFSPRRRPKTLRHDSP